MLIPVIGWIFFGLLIGAIARAIYPGRQDMGLIRTTLLGVGGSFVGGFVGFLLFGGSPVHAAGWIGSIVGAVAILAIGTRRDRIEA
ncbi:MAG: GlsB/YeaQ/YmgE family stress response membrane protein [Rubripirellula sp.]